MLNEMRVRMYCQACARMPAKPAQNAATPMTARSGLPWSAEEREILAEGLIEGASINELCAQLPGRPYTAIVQRCWLVRRGVVR